MSHLLHCSPWFTVVYHGIPWYMMVCLPWYTMVYHSKPWYHTIVYHGIFIPCLHYRIAEELIQLKYTITQQAIQNCDSHHSPGIN